MNDGTMRKKNNEDGMDNGANLRRSKSVTGSTDMSKSLSSKDMKLPKINFNRKAARSVSRVNKDTDDELNLMNNKVQQRMIALQDSIANYREEYDFVVQMKSIVGKRLQDLKVMGANINVDELLLKIIVFVGCADRPPENCRILFAV